MTVCGAIRGGEESAATISFLEVKVGEEGEGEGVGKRGNRRGSWREGKEWGRDGIGERVGGHLRMAFGEGRWESGKERDSGPVVCGDQPKIEVFFSKTPKTSMSAWDRKEQDCGSSPGGPSLCG